MRYLVKKNTMVLHEEIQVIRGGDLGVLLLMVTQVKKRYVIIKWPTSHFQTGFYINGSGQKVSESFFLKPSESLYTEGTHVYV